MIDVKQAKMYSEVYEILQILGENYKNKIPPKQLSLIENSKLENYTPVYDKNIPLYKQLVDKKTAAFICMLHLNYWCESEKEKQQIQKILAYNQKKNFVKYNQYQEIFKKKKTEDYNQTKHPVPIKIGILEKLKQFFKAFFRK